MAAKILFEIAAYVTLCGAIISSIFWIFLSYTWWHSEKKRIKKSKQFDL